MKPMLFPVILLLSSIFIGINSHITQVKYSVPVYKENFGSALKDVQNQVDDATDQLNHILSSIGMSSSKASMLIEKTNSIIDFLHATIEMTPAQRFKCPRHSGQGERHSLPGERGEMKLDEERGLCYLYENDEDGDSPKTYDAAKTYCESDGGTLLQPVLSDPTLIPDLIALFPDLPTATGGPVFIGICAEENPVDSDTYVWKTINGYYPSEAEVNTITAEEGMCLALGPSGSGPPTLVAVDATNLEGFICQYTPLTMFPPFEESNLDKLDDTQIPDSEEMVDVEAEHPHHHHDNEGGNNSMEEPESEPEHDIAL